MTTKTATARTATRTRKLSEASMARIRREVDAEAAAMTDLELWRATGGRLQLV